MQFRSRTEQGGALRFDLPAAGAARGRARAAATDGEAAPPDAVETRDEWRRRERRAIETALARAEGRVFGARGAAALLGMKPTTLASRIKALRIERAPGRR